MRADWSRERAFRIDEDGCWLWRGPVHSKGHPTIALEPGRTALLRRCLLALKLGRPLLPAERAIVACGKALCCAPRCLRAASHSTVGKLAVARNDWTKSHARRLKIAQSRPRKWTDEQVAAMRARDIETGGKQRKAIAASLGTTTGHICHILNYKSHVLRLPDAVRHAVATNALRYRAREGA